LHGGWQPNFELQVEPATGQSAASVQGPYGFEPDAAPAAPPDPPLPPSPPPPVVPAAARPAPA